MTQSGTTPLALIDGDIVAFRCAASCSVSQKAVKESLMNDLPIPEPLNAGIAIARTNELMDRILYACKTARYRVFVSGTENFRKLLYPDYKRHRDDMPKPEHLDTLRDLLLREWGAEVTAGYEADDGIGIAVEEDSIICSIDKDFRQIPGQHFNFVKDVFETITPDMASLAFWSHMLIGDVSDNIRGVEGIGPVKSNRQLAALSPEEREARVYELYGDPERFALNQRLLKILRTEEEYNEIEEFLREGKGSPFATTYARHYPSQVPELGAG